ncbi:MAG: flagellar biosynthesis protein FlhB [Vampirovibrio sp.]|nr:flagellar biosynthesis protein FlhB [Vampirovibrio sp.]
MGDEDKQFEATPHKLKKAREEGQVFKSKDLSTAVFLIVMFALLFYLAPFVWNQILAMFILIFEQIPYASIEEVGWQRLMLLTVKALVFILAPFIAVALLTAISTDFLQVGPLIAFKAIEPKVDKLNPVKGFKNIFSSRTAVELVKNILKMVILGIVAYIVFMEFLPKLLTLGESENIFALIAVLGQLLLKFSILSGIAFFIIGGGDFLFQRWKFMKDQKMSFKEIKDEFKQTEGDPMVKQALRQRRMQMMQRSMLEAVPTADVVTTNPIHIAVALKYNADSMEAPRVVAKGTELFAQRIIDIANQNEVPVVQNVPVARALHQLVDIDQEIPANLYQAVAEILMFAWRSQGKPVPFLEEAETDETPEDDGMGTPDNLGNTDPTADDR